MIFPQL